MKLTSYSILIGLFTLSCNSIGKQIDKSKFSNILGEKQSIIISCFHCKCAINELNSLIKSDSDLISKYVIYGDSSCIKEFTWRNKMVQLNQSELDLLSLDIYNLAVYNPKQFGETLQIISTEKMTYLSKYLK